LRGTRGRLFPVGRLEFDAAGLLLLTNDGELASDLMRAAAAIPQVWRFKVKGRIPEDSRQQLEREARVRLRLYRDGTNAWYEADVHDAPRDLLRQTLFRRGFLVEKMVRFGFGGIDLGSLAPGEMRELTPQELGAVRRAARGHTTPIEAAASAPPLAVRRGPGQRPEEVTRDAGSWRPSRSHFQTRQHGRPGRPSRPGGTNRHGRRRRQEKRHQ
jgi:23S rRNA pseudouridine2605 synthase